MSDQIIEQKNFADKQNKMTTVIRVVHNKENPYVQLSRQSLWDSNLSLRAVGLWVRCMSRKDTWTFHLNELIKNCKEGRDAIQTAMNELIEHRYVTRIEYHHREKGKFIGGGIQYIFFEYKATEEEIAEQLEIFKKSFQQQDFQETGNQVPGNPHLIRIDNKKRKISNEEYTSLKVSPDEGNVARCIPKGNATCNDHDAYLAAEAVASMPAKAGEKRKSFSPEVEEIGQELIEVVLETKPDYKPPASMAKIYQSVDLMLRVDKREAAKILRVFRWALADSFWADKFFKPDPAKYLREKFDQLDAKMNAKALENPHKIDRRLRDKNGNPIKDDMKDNLF